MYLHTTTSNSNSIRLVLAAATAAAAATTTTTTTQQHGQICCQQIFSLHGKDDSKSSVGDRDEMSLVRQGIHF